LAKRGVVAKSSGLKNGRDDAHPMADGNPFQHLPYLDFRRLRDSHQGSSASLYLRKPAFAMLDFKKLI